MRRLPTILAAAVLLGALAGCADVPSAPTTPPPEAAGATLLGLDLTPALRRTVPLAADLTVRARIGSEGGVLAIPGAGLRVVVPARAVAAPTDFVVTAIAGSAVAYEFAPHGLRFARPLRVTQELRGTDWIGLALLDFRAVYFEQRDQVDAVEALIDVDEVLPLSIDLLRLRAGFDVEHFSGYGISTGRSRTAEQ